MHEWKQLKQENTSAASVRKADAQKESPGVELVVFVVQITPTHIKMSTSNLRCFSLHHTHVFQTFAFRSLKTDESQNNQKGPFPQRVKQRL